MKTSHSKVMGLAIASGKVGFVILRHGELQDWKLSRTAARSPERVQAALNNWLALYQPDCVVTEAINPYSRKSNRTLALMKAAEGVIKSRKIKHRAVPRIRNFPNKYEEITALSLKHPKLAPWAPEPRKFYEPEPTNTILFEALALVEQALRK